MDRRATPEDFARVAVKTRQRRGYAQRQQARSLAGVLNDPPIDRSRVCVAP
jgi:hypothetical protein